MVKEILLIFFKKLHKQAKVSRNLNSFTATVWFEGSQLSQDPLSSFTTLRVKNYLRLWLFLCLFKQRADERKSRSAVTSNASALSLLIYIAQSRKLKKLFTICCTLGNYLMLQNKKLYARFIWEFAVHDYLECIIFVLQ